MDRDELAQYLDHTLLKPEATDAEVAALCAEGLDLAVFAVCVSAARVPAAAAALTAGAELTGRDGAPALCSVVGFPSGAHHPDVVAAEAARAVEAGAVEVDMVVDLGLVHAGDRASVQAGIRTVRQACPGALLKVIIESAALTDDQVVACCEAAEAAGANYVKTSTGFHPAGGASTQAVALMRKTVGDRLGVKASGGIRDTATALAMIDVGASRIGCSATAAILAGLD